MLVAAFCSTIVDNRTLWKCNPRFSVTHMWRIVSQHYSRRYAPLCWSYWFFVWVSLRKRRRNPVALQNIPSTYALYEELHRYRYGVGENNKLLILLAEPKSLSVINSLVERHSCPLYIFYDLFPVSYATGIVCLFLELHLRYLLGNMDENWSKFANMKLVEWLCLFLSFIGLENPSGRF